MNLPAIHNPRWHDQAACRGTPDTIWFNPERRTSRNNEAAAKTICRQCPVLADCGLWINSVESRSVDRKFGIYGALTPTERYRYQDLIGLMTPQQYTAWIDQQRPNRRRPSRQGS